MNAANQKLIEAASDQPAAWNALTESLNYRGSSPNGSHVPSLQPTPDGFNTVYNFLSSVPLGPDQLHVTWLGVALSPNVAEAHPLDQPSLNINQKKGPQFLLVTDAQLMLDNMLLKNVIIKKSEVLYKGKPMDLENVRFFDCSFNIAKLPAGLRLATALLHDESITLKVD